MRQRRFWGAAQCAALIVALMAVLAPPEAARAQGTAVFSRIDVAGNQRIEADTIRVISGIEAGQPATPEDLNLAVRRLFASGLFEDVEVAPEAGRLVITVVENPTINQIAFEGNDALTDEELVELVELQPRLAYSVAAAEADAQRIIDAYAQSGRYGAQVTPVIIRRPDNRVDLVFEVFEGRVTSVQRINFIGNRAFPDRRLRRVVQTNQSTFLSFLFGSTTYDADRLELDSELLRQFYRERGYIDFQVLSSTAEIVPERSGFFLTFTVDEGRRYSYGAISVSSSVPELNPAEFQPLLAPIRPGTVYDQSEVDTIVERMAFQAGQQGYAFIDIVPQLTRNPAAGTVDINFELQEGERVFIERIDIVGNTRTLDRVIRRQFRVVEGDAFNAREIREAEDRIRALGYFSAVTLDVRQGSAPDRTVLTVEVEEQPTGSLNIGGAYSTSEGLIGQIGITERNFLGRGQTLSGSFALSSEFQNIELGFFEPAVLDRDLLAGFNVYWRERDFSERSFQETNIGIEPVLGFPLSENGRLRLRYRLSSDEIRDVSSNTSQIIIDEEGRLTTSALGFTYSYDRRNSAVEPTAGFILTFEQDFAGLGGDTRYSRSVGTARAYRSFFDENLVLSAELEGGAIISDEGTRITNRFTAGGDSFRGFARNGLGPRDFCDAPDCVTGQTDVDDALGGNYFSILRLDASFPIGLPEEYGIFGGVFADVGSLWGLDETDGSMGEVDDDFYLRSSIGVSLFIDTPFAPLRFNFAKPLRKKDYDVTETFRFTLQTRF
jgi:outer membrane protein insertion porin family